MRGLALVLARELFSGAAPLLRLRHSSASAPAARPATYYPIGGLIANAISSPPQLVLTAQASNGSVANVNAIASGALESGFTQADVAYWAYSGTGLFEGKGKMEDLRLLANLYPESIHLVAAKSANIKSVADLKGKRVSMDEPGSGTLVDARIILSGYGLKEADVKTDFLKPNQAAEKMRDGGMDAFFFVGGYPTSAITELAATGGGIEIVPLDGAGAEAIRKQYSFFAADEIPANTYKNVGQVKTLAVGAQWVTSAKVADAVVYQVVKGLLERQDPRRARRGSRERQDDPQGNSPRGRRHSGPSGRRALLQGSRHYESLIVASAEI